MCKSVKFPSWMRSNDSNIACIDPLAALPFRKPCTGKSCGKKLPTLKEMAYKGVYRRDRPKPYDVISESAMNR